MEGQETPSAAALGNPDDSSDDDSPSGDLGTGLASSSGALLSGLPGLSAHEEESRRAQEYWKRAAAPYQAVDTLRLASGGGHVSSALETNWQTTADELATNDRDLTCCRMIERSSDSEGSSPTGSLRGVRGSASRPSAKLWHRRWTPLWTRTHVCGL